MGAKGILQSGLSRVRCEWGKEVHEHPVAHPVFGRNYHVRGLLAFTPRAQPLWYGEVPVYAVDNVLRFKAAFQEGGPRPLRETEHDVFTDSFLCDPWGMIADALVEFAASAGDRELPRNIYGLLLRGGTIADVEFEPPLHAVRAVVIRRGTFRAETLPVLGIPALAESMTSPPESSGYRFRWPGVAKD